MVLQKARSPIVSLAAKQALWAPAYARVQSIIGITTGVILPFGDPNHEASNFTTFTTRGVEQLVFTWSEARTSFDTPLEYVGPGQVPVVTFNGTDEEADSPDAGYWTHGNGTVDTAFSVACWVNNKSAISINTTMLAKQSSVNIREWLLDIQNDGYWEMRVIDSSQNRNRGRTYSVVPSIDTWYHVVGTYGGDESDPNASITLYINGVSVGDADVSTAGIYDSMEDTDAIIGFAQNSNNGSRWNGAIAGGPCGMIHTGAELTANQVKALYQTGREMLGV